MLPLPAAEITLRFEHTQAEAVALMNAWAGKPWPITATCHVDTCMSGSPALSPVCAAPGQDSAAKSSMGNALWQQVREHELAFFQGAQALWRLVG